MSDDEYQRWVQFHAGLFAMQSKADVDLFRLWRESLELYTLAECEEASRWLAETQAGAFRTEHLARLRGRMLERRREAQRRASLGEMPTGSSVCATCGGSGLVAVPHLRYVQEGEWRHFGRGKPEMVVSCRCWLGKRRAETFDGLRIATAGRVGGMGLDEYAARVPNWRELLEEERGRAARELQAHQLAAVADRKRPLKRPAFAPPPSLGESA